jgi:hypothetical protein
MQTMRCGLRALVVLAAIAPAGACAAAVNLADLASVEEAQVAARVKSVLVNDPDIGVHPIQVRVDRATAVLSGYVPDVDDEARALALAREVPGIAQVRSELSVGGQPPPPPVISDDPVASPVPLSSSDPLGGASDNRMLAVGAAIGWNASAGRTLDPSESIGPLIRLGSGRGLGLAVGFSWFGSDLLASDNTEEIIGRVRIKPVMGGLGYTVRNDRVSMSLSAVAGLAFNSVVPGESIGRAVPLDVTNSLAWRPAVSFWFDASGRVALNASAGYVMTRPQLSVLRDGEVVRRRLEADTFLLRVGMAYKVF